MPRSARVGTLLFLVYPLLMGFEVVWIVFGPTWFDAARFWADVHVPSQVPQMIAGASLWLLVGWGLWGRKRAAWFAAVSMSGLLGVGGLLSIAVPTLTGEGAGLAAVGAAHPLEAFMVIFSMLVLGTSMLFLMRSDSRAWYLAA